MDSTGREESAKPRPIAAGLLIALTAPLLGLCPILVWFALGMGEFSLGHLTVRSTILIAYFFGSIQSIIAGLLVGLAIRRRGWISAQYWMALTAILALAPIVLLGITTKAQPATSGPSIILYFTMAALFASLALRLIIIRLGWMRG